MNRILSMSFQEFVDSFSRCLHRECVVLEGKPRDAVWNRLKLLFVTMLAVEQCASWRQRWPRAEQEGESESRGTSPCASLVSYRAWPEDQGRFYSREAEPRVPASRRDAAGMRRGEERRGLCRGQEWLEGRKGSGRRREGDGIGEVRATTERKKDCTARRREGRLEL